MINSIHPHSGRFHTEMVVMTDTTDTLDSSEPIISSLSRKFTANGKSVQIDICENGMGGWLLEIIDAYDNSTCWQAPFRTDQEAFDEGIRALEEEGVDYFFGTTEPRPTCRWFQPSKNVKKVFNIQLQK